MFASAFFGAIGWCQWSQVVVRVHARAPAVASFLRGARCARPCSQVMFRAHSACSRDRKSFFRQSPVSVVGRARSAPLHCEEVGDYREGDAVGAPGRARDRVVRGGSGGPRRPSVRRRSYGYPLSHGCAPWCARLGVEGCRVELRRRRGRCFGTSSGVRGMGVGPPRSGRDMDFLLSGKSRPLQCRACKICPPI